MLPGPSHSAFTEGKLVTLAWWGCLTMQVSQAGAAVCPLRNESAVAFLAYDRVQAPDCAPKPYKDTHIQKTVKP